MPEEFKLPDLGEGIHEGEIIQVLVSVGQKVLEGHPILIVETDKASVEIPSPVSGTVIEIRVKPGQLVKVGEVLMIFQKELENGFAQIISTGDKALEPSPTPGERFEISLPQQASPASGAAVGPVPATPSTRRLARELGIDLKLVSGTGPAGRVTADDVRSFAEKHHREEVEQSIDAPTEEPVSTVTTKPPSLPDFTRWGTVRREPLRSIRRSTARHMTLAWSQIPHVTHQDVADITELETLRRRIKGEIELAGGSLSLTVFVMKAAVAALKTIPRFNASLDTEREEIVIKDFYNIGVAVDTDRGLIVPVIRDVDRKSIRDLALELSEMLNRARAGKLEREELTGGTFTITNIGPLGGTGFTPIINYPEVAILGMARARMSPVVQGEEGDYEIVPRLILPLVLGFDHRVLDGADAARFLGMVVSCLNDPERLFIRV